jgi:hypothetical protein
MSIVPQKLAIYYGYPSLINGATTIQAAIDVFKAYDVVVLGAGLEVNSHPDHTKTTQIITNSQLSNTKFFSYIDCTKTLNKITSTIDKIKATGMDGVFCDRFGYDFATTRSKQNNIVNYIHGKSMIAFVNSWDPDDTFGSIVHPQYNPSSTAPIINSNDWYLIQSFQILNGEYQDPVFWQVRSDTVSGYKNIFGTNIACVTTYGTETYDQNKADYSYYSAVLYNFDAWGWGEYIYSAVTCQLPFRSRKPIVGTQFVNIINGPTDGLFFRDVNIGIKINTNDHTTSLII